jgi:hypothetical protein
MNKNRLNFIAFGIGFLLSGTLALADTDESATRDFRAAIPRSRGKGQIQLGFQLKSVYERANN